MANDYISLADLAVFNNKNLADIYVTDLFQDAPLLQVLSAVPATNGNLHYYQKTTQAPVVGFRAANDGREHDSTVRLGVTVTLTIADASFTIDKAVADAYFRGAEMAIQMEAMEHLKQMFFTIEKQLLVGTIGGAATGFAGLADQANLNQLADAQTYNAGGNSALTSVYLIRSGQADVSVVTGNGGNIDVGETVIQSTAGATTGTMPAYYTPIGGWYGLQLGSVNSAVRICNIEDDTLKLTDALVYKGLELFPASRQPTHIVMNRRSLEQLRASRTATNMTGYPAPRPTEVEGIPIIVTDALGNAETAIV